ncbi:MAG: hypothetical protein O2816_13730 [Planctomycetota bacterium]|nr:hypothetical protein [Planctomycetota bacterium]
MTCPRSALLLLALAGLLAGCAGGAGPSSDVEPARFEQGVSALVEATRSWREDRGCISCHTTGWGLAAQPLIAPGSEEVRRGREFAQDYLRSFLDGEAEPRGQYGSVEGRVATTAFLAMSDARSGAGLQAPTRRGIDHAWELLDESGTWEDWLQCNWPPYESDAEFGPTLMLVALGELSAAEPLPARDVDGVARLTGYLRAHPPASLHAKAMRLWAGSWWPQALTAQERQSWRQELRSTQGADGGWSMASLSGPAWRRDGGEGQTTTSEAYATAFSTYVLLQVGSPPEDDDVHQGLRWLREHQLEDGAWFTRSPRRDGKHYISRAATAFALMALKEAADSRTGTSRRLERAGTRMVEVTPTTEAAISSGPR